MEKDAHPQGEHKEGRAALASRTTAASFTKQQPLPITLLGLFPAVLFFSAREPKAVFQLPVVSNCNAETPKPVSLVPVVILLVGGWAAWLPRDAPRWGVLLIGVALVALNGYTLLRVLVPGFAPIA